MSNLGPNAFSVSPTIDLINLNCLVLGDDPSCTFQVEIALTATVSALKDAIKQKRAPEFDTIAAARLELWRVNLSVEKEIRPQLQDNDKISRSPMLKLSKFFSGHLDEEHVHIVIKLPHLVSSISPAVDLISLNCLVLGDDPSCIFSVKIAQTGTVGDLKELIKEEKRPEFDTIAADRLELWKVDKLSVEDAVRLQLKDEDMISRSPILKLSKIFSHLDEERLHVVIQPPLLASSGPHHLKLNCFILGEEPGHTFPVDIAPTQTVGDLKKLIKEEKRPEFDTIAADRLELWKVNIKLKKGVLKAIKVKTDIEDQDGEELEDTWTLLSEIFTRESQSGHLHIIVLLPLQRSPRSLSQPSPSESHHRTKQLRLEYSQNYPEHCPSSQGIPSRFQKLQNQEEHTIHWNRPPTAANIIPPTLLHPIFGTFIDDCESHDPTEEDNKLVMALSEAMSGFFKDEPARASEFRDVLRRHGIDLTAATIDYTNYTTDGDMRCGGLLYAIAEVKNEIGSKAAEPHAQAISYYIHSSKTSAPQKNFRFPCILIGLFGPYIDFSAAVWSTRPNMQVLSTVLPLCYHHTDTKMRAMVSRHVGALRKALQSLKKCYERIESNPTSPSPEPDLKFPDSEFPDAQFPYPCSYTCMETSLTHRFTYISQMDATKLLFAAQTDKEKICIKFVRRYSREVHQLCASKNFAPALYGIENLPGGWYMIVMEMIGEDYCCLGDFSARYSHRADIAAKLETLHQHNWVHGDIRDTNIMVKKDGSPGIRLVDFDWSGKIGEIRYPINVYRGKGLWRPDGARDGQLILAEHDIQMLNALF